MLFSQHFLHSLRVDFVRIQIVNNRQHDLSIKVVWIDECVGINLLHSFDPDHQSKEEHKQATSIQSFSSIDPSKVRNAILNDRTEWALVKSESCKA